MATSLEKISELLTKADVKHTVEAEFNRIVTGTATELYKDPEGRPGVLVFIALDEDGGYVSFIAPTVYLYKEGPHKGAVLEACMLVSYMTKFVQFEYEPDSGRVHATIELPLEDSELTQRQLFRCLHALTSIIDEHYDIIQGAINTGKVVRESPEEIAKAIQEFLKERKKKRLSEEPAAPGPGLALEE
jgi:hypothetical protein